MTKFKSPLLVGTTAAMLFSASLAPVSQAAPAKKAPAKKPAGNAGKVALQLKLPRAAFMGTPKAIPPGTTVDRSTLGKHRGAFFVPAGLTNVAAGKPVTSSDERPIIGSLPVVTDGDKEATDGSWVTLAPGKQWVQIDLKKAYNIYAIVVWHYHGEARIYRDVVVQVADDPDFITNVRTVFNADQHNQLGLGIGHDRDYFESNEGKLIDAKGVKGRYVRLYTNGNTSDDENNYTEVEVYGK